MSYEAETFEDRIVRLFAGALRDPVKTRELLARLSKPTKQTPQPGSKPAEVSQPLEQVELFR